MANPFLDAVQGKQNNIQTNQNPFLEAVRLPTQQKNQIISTPVEEPSTLTKISGGFQEAIGGTGKTIGERLLNAGKTIGSAIISPFKHPITTTISAGKGAVDAFLGIEQGITNFVGADKASEYIKNNREALNSIVDTNLNPENSKEKSTAIAVGNFVGEQVPYLLAGEATAAVGTAGAISGLAKYGGNLSLKATENIGRATKLASEAAGFMGLDQITYTPEEGSRIDVLKKDAIVLGTLGIIGEGISSLKNLKAIRDIRNYSDEIKAGNVSATDLEKNITKLNNDVKVETGKTPQELVKENIKQYPINLKEVPQPVKSEIATQPEKVNPFMEAVKPTEAKPITEIKPEIPKGQESLYQEARKYKSAEEFVNTQVNNFGQDTIEAMKNDGLDNLINEDGSITLYHKTTPLASSKIERGGFKSDSYFASSPESAQELASTNKKGGSKIMEIKVNPADISYSYSTGEFYSEVPLKKSSKGIYEGVNATYSDNLTKSQLTDIWNKANKPEIPSERINIQKNLKAGNVQQVNLKTPQFGGKVSEAWKRNISSLDLTPEEVNNLGYAGLTKDSAIKSATNLIDADAGKAYRVAMNLERSPGDTTNNIVNKLLIRKAKQEGNTALQAELALNRIKTNTRRGQEIWSEQLLKNGRSQETPEFSMKQLLDERVKLFEKKSKITVKQATEKEIGSIKSKIKVVSKDDFKSFIDSIKC